MEEIILSISMSIVAIIFYYFMFKLMKSVIKNLFHKIIKNLRESMPKENFTTSSSLISNDINNINNDEINYKMYYQPKRYIITLTELKFYNVLLQIAKELDLILLTQVSLYNIIEPKNTNYKNTAFNKIRSKSIDFVLADKKDCRIKLCIELDDITHKRYDRIQRDEFINKLFNDLEIDFLRFKASNYYDKEALKKRIVESIKEHIY